MDRDLLATRLPGFNRKLTRAKDLIDKALKHSKNPYLSWSTGKDSTAMLCLVAEQNPNVTIMMYDSGYELPENKDYANYVLGTLGISKDRIEVIRPPRDPLEEKIKAGYFDLKAIAKVNERVMFRPIREWAKNGGYDLAFIGLRKQESAARRMTMRMNGEYFYCKRNAIQQCYPMADFSAQEVFGLLAVFNINPHPAYDKTKFAERDWVRVNWWIVSAGVEKGTALWLKYYYPELFAILAERNPAVKEYV